jgi:hypothetical protein
MIHAKISYMWGLRSSVAFLYVLACLRFTVERISMYMGSVGKACLV